MRIYFDNALNRKRRKHWALKALKHRQLVSLIQLHIAL